MNRSSREMRIYGRGFPCLNGGLNLSRVLSLAEIVGMWRKIGGNLLFTLVAVNLIFPLEVFFPIISKSRPIVTNSECKEQWCTLRFFDWGLIVITVIRYITEAAKFFFLKKSHTAISIGVSVVM